MGTGALPKREVRAILRVLVGRCYISRVVTGIAVEQRNMADCHQIGCRADFFPVEGIAQPFLLGFPVGSTGKQTGEDRVCVEFVLCRVEPDQGDITLPDGEIAAEIPVAGQPLFRLSEHPHPFQGVSLA